MNPERIEAATVLSREAPPLSRWQNVRAGTAGWTDKGLIKSGLFYPKGVSDAAGRLGFYAREFSLVEVDATYYTLLPPATAEKWVENTPPSFVFDVKAHPILTGHPIDVTRMPGDLKAELARLGHERRVYADRLPAALAQEIEARFRALVEPLLHARRLGCVMLQLPPWATATRGNVRRIEAVAERWAGVPLAVEFRHPSWLDPARRQRVLDMLSRLHLSYVCVDEPDVAGGGVPPITVVTNSDLAILRFHGHNDAGWHKGASVEERFDYLYAPAELHAWVTPLRRLARESQEVHVVFNNCVRNYAVLNAKDLAALLLSTPETPADTDSSVAGRSRVEPG